MTPQPDSNPKTAVGRLKPPMHAIPPSAILALGLAMENGEGKYGLMNWRASAVSSSVYYDAALRHLLSWWDGEDVTPDSGVHHLAHVMACCAILIDAEVSKALLDDRPLAGPAAAMIAHLQAERAGEVAQPPAGVMWLDDEPTAPIESFWRNFFHKRKEPTMPTELETIAAAVARSNATSEKTLAIVQNLSVKIELIRSTTTDPATAAKLLDLANSLNAESDKVDAGDALGQGELDSFNSANPVPPADPAPPADTPPPVDPVPDPSVNDQSATTPPVTDPET